MKKYPIPTGYLLVDNYEKGELETLSIGDYGKQYNVKADFLGYSKPISGVENRACLPLSEKWVVTLSTQYGCTMKCNFCDVPNVRFKGNVSEAGLVGQLYSAIKLFPHCKYTERLNIHFARMGDPIFNEAVFSFSERLFEDKKLLQEELGLRVETLHPVLTTSMPRGFSPLVQRLSRWVDIKNEIYNGQAGLQLSINSTDDKQREVMFGGSALTLASISEIARDFSNPVGRKYCLNFAYSTDFEVSAVKLRRLFDPEKFMVKITPIHNNNACRASGIETKGGYESYRPYEKLEESLKAEGFDVLVFIPSLDEERGLVTCGNAVLGGSKMGDVSVVNIKGLPFHTMNKDAL